MKKRMMLIMTNLRIQLCENMYTHESQLESRKNEELVC